MTIVNYVLIQFQILKVTATQMVMYQRPTGFVKIATESLLSQMTLTLLSKDLNWHDRKASM